jgi:hypothetical protein
VRVDDGDINFKGASRPRPLPDQAVLQPDIATLMVDRHAAETYTFLMIPSTPLRGAKARAIALLWQPGVALR